MAARMEEVSIALLGRVQRAGPAGYVGIVAAFLVWVLVRAHQPLAPSAPSPPAASGQFSLPTTPLEIGISYVYGPPARPSPSSAARLSASGGAGGCRSGSRSS